MLLLSVAEPVKIISRKSAPMILAIFPRDSSTAAIASWPKEWSDEGLPNRAEKYGFIAFKTSGATGVVAA
jgi:hypothetical protein